MTCIVGLVDGETVWIGGDSMGSDGNSRVIRDDEKVFQSGDFLIGFASSYRVGQLLRYRLDVPAQTDQQTDHEFLCTTFVDAVRDCLKAEPPGTDFRLLVGYRGGLYRVDSDGNVGIHACGYAALGDGEDFALGALYASGIHWRDGKWAQHDRVHLALSAAAEQCVFVGRPFTILSI